MSYHESGENGGNCVTMRIKENVEEIIVANLTKSVNEAREGRIVSSLSLSLTSVILSYLCS